MNVFWIWIWIFEHTKTKDISWQYALFARACYQVLNQLICAVIIIHTQENYTDNRHRPQEVDLNLDMRTHVS